MRPAPVSTVRVCGRLFVSFALALLLCRTAEAQFAPPVSVNLGIGTPPASITGTVSGDLNGDTFLDLVGTDNASPGLIGLALGNGAGGYTVMAPVVDPAGSPSGAFLPKLADFDLDGNLDLAYAGTTPFAGATDTAVFILRGVPSGANYTFVPAVIVTVVPLPSTITGLRTTDYDGDGLQDVLVTSSSALPGGSRIGLIRNLGGFTFGPLTSSTTATGAAEIDVCVDYNGDGRKDAVICRPIPGSISFVDVYAGVGPPQFFGASPTISLALPAGFEPLDVHWVECDQQNGYDLAVSAGGPNPGLLLIRNLGAPPFFSPPIGVAPFPVNGIPAAIQRLEVDFDGIQDLTVYEIGTSPISLKPTAFEVLRVDDCTLSQGFVTNIGNFDTGALDEAVSDVFSAGDQEPDGRSEVVTIDHTSAVNDRVLVFPHVTPISFSITPSQPLLGQTVPFTFHIQAPSALANRQFWVLFSIAGTKPGTPIAGGLTLPLNLPLLPVIIPGQLDAAANGTFTTTPIVIPDAPRLFSLQLASAFAVRGAAGGAAFVSNPALVTVP